MLGPFAAPLPPHSVTVTLRDGAGRRLPQQDFTRKDASGGNRARPDPLPLRRARRVHGLRARPDLSRRDGAGLGARSASTAHRARTTSTSTTASQNRAAASTARSSPRWAARATRSTSSSRTRPARCWPTRTASRSRCGKGDGEGCPSADSYNYHLTGLPTDPIPVTAVLNMVAGEKATKFQVDSADFTLDPSGQTTAPDLTGIADPPNAVNGRTLYGQLNFLRPFAPGARSARRPRHRGAASGPGRRSRCATRTGRPSRRSPSSRGRRPATTATSSTSSTRARTARSTSRRQEGRRDVEGRHPTLVAERHPPRPELQQGRRCRVRGRFDPRRRHARAQGVRRDH